MLTVVSMLVVVPYWGARGLRALRVEWRQRCSHSSWAALLGMFPWQRPEAHAFEILLHRF